VGKPGRGHRKDRRGRRLAKAVHAPLPDRRRNGAEPPSARLLQSVAGALNACEAAGIIVQLAHGAVITDEGYVFAVGAAGGRWAARSRTLTGFPAADGDD